MPVSETDDIHPFVEELQAEAGDALRSVTRYDEDSYDILYLRDTVNAIYSGSELDAIFEDLRLEGWGREHLEDLFNAGALECSIYGFEDAMMFHFVTSGFTGVLVTYDRDAGIKTERFIEACKSELDP